MSFGEVAQLLVVAGIVAVLAPPLGAYLARVYSDGGAPAPGERFFARVERPIYRLCRIDASREQTWAGYAVSLLAFSAVSVFALYALMRLQAFLPLNPADREAVPGPLAFNTAISFVTNTNWQAYGGEQTMSHLSQMLGLSVQNFVSAAAGIGVMLAIIRGLVRRRSATVGNFWVDLTRTTVRVLIPMAIVSALLLVATGVVQNFHGFTESATGQLIPGGPAASQIAIKQLGTNGGGFFNANSAHPFENPDGLSNLLEVVLIVVLPFALIFAFGRLVGDRREGHVLVAVMAALWLIPATLGMLAETGGNPALEPLGADQSTTTELAGGGNLEGKEVRFGAAGSAVWAATTTGTSNGSVNAAHDSFTPLGGLVPLGEMLLGEVSPGGVGVGLMGMLVYAILAVFIVGLMVGRTPEYLGKKIGPTQIKLAALYLLAMPLTVLGLTAVSVAVPAFRDGLANPGAHGLTEVLYAFASGTNNNGSAFGGLASAEDWYAVSIGVAMFIGRFALIIPALAVAGSLAREKTSARTVATFPTGSPLFGFVLLGVVLVVTGLVFFPTLALGPITEHLQLNGGTP